MSDFKLTVGHKVTVEEALKAADKVEAEIGEIMNGERKPGNVSVESIAHLVAFARNMKDLSVELKTNADAIDRITNPGERRKKK